MASYSTEQLRGAGVPTEALSGNKTFTFTNASSGSAYFTIQTTLNNTGSYAGRPTNALGVYDNFTTIDADYLITSSYVASVVIPEGGGSFRFNPTTNVAVSSSMLRGTGEISLVIS